MYSGHGNAERFGPATAMVLDFGVDAQDSVTILSSDGGQMSVRRIAADGREEASWKPALPAGLNVLGMVVAPDGAVLLVCPGMTFVYDRAGALIATWKDPMVWTPELAVLPDGRVLSAWPSHAAVVMIRRDGTVEREWQEFEGGPGRFFEPASVRIHGSDILVMQTDRRVLLFRNTSPGFDPVFVRDFSMSFTEKAVQPRGASFDGDNRIVAPDPGTTRVLLYGKDGKRLLAEDPRRDLSNRGFGGVVRFVGTRDRLYVLDSNRQLWIVSR